MRHGCVPTHPVIFAVKQGNLAVLRNLLADDETLDINEQDELGNTALHYAVMREKRHIGDMCRYLLIEKKAKCNIQNKKGKAPYLLYPDSDCLTSCLEGETQTGGGQSDNRMTSLHYAVQYADVEGVCSLLLDSITDESKRDRWGMTARARAGSRLIHWKKKSNQQMISRMKKIVAMLDNPNHSCRS